MEPEDLLKGLRPAATSNVTTFDQIPYRHRAFLSGMPQNMFGLSSKPFSNLVLLISRAFTF